MASNLGIYNKMTEVKVKERDELEAQIKRNRLAIKALKKESLALLRSEQDFRREAFKVQKVLSRKQEERFFMQKEIAEIKEQLPLVSVEY